MDSAAYVIPVWAIPAGWVVQAIRHRYWVAARHPEDAWVADLLHRDGDGIIVSGKGPSPLAAVEAAIAEIQPVTMARMPAA